MTQVIDNVKNVLKEIYENGCSINGTKEQQMLEFDIEMCLSYNNLMKEEFYVEKFYDENIGSYKDKLKGEIDHYNFLKCFMFHKIKENQYFFKLKSDDFTSRKNVIWSSDCISNIQFISREGCNIMFVTMRSSDTIKLLPLDIMYMMFMFSEILSKFDIKSNEDDYIRFMVVSAHYYDTDEKIVKDILKIK